MSKKKIAALCVVGVLVVSAAVASFAWSSAWSSSKDSVTNRFTSAKVDVSLQELNWQDENGEQLRIGDTVSKNPTVTANDGDIYCAITMHIRDKDGNEITDRSVLNYINSFIYYDPDGVLEDGVSYTSDEIAELNLDTVNSKFVRDGNTNTFYLMSKGKYTKLSDCDSEELFTNIVVPRDITKEEWITNMSPLESFTLDFEVKAVLADSFDELDGSNPSEIYEVLKN